jgi:hypothetical protein
MSRNTYPLAMLIGEPSETTPGVSQASGYGDLTSTKSILYVTPFLLATHTRYI